MKTKWLIQKAERLLGHKAFWSVAKRFNRWINLTKYYACVKKIDFRSEETAWKSANEMNQKGKARNELEAYNCRYCQGWHIGRKKKTDGKRQGEMVSGASGESAVGCEKSS